MNGETHETTDDFSELAYAIVDRTLTAIGGLETADPVRALDVVLDMYERALKRLEG